MDKWKYISVNAKLLTWKDNGHISVSEQLNKLGEEGWEMTASDGTYLYFKKKEDGKDDKADGKEPYSLFKKPGI